MGGDYSRDSFDSLRDNAALLLQQGRPATDADWNELVKTLVRRQRSETVDTIGRAVVPRETEHGFEIRLNGSNVEIGRGRKYLAGLQIENHGSANFKGDDEAFSNPVLDRGRNDGSGPEGVLNEMISHSSGDFMDYLHQPYWPTPTPVPTDGRTLAYAIAWEREVTALHAPEILEPALGGIDSSTRLQTVWQVRLAENIAEGSTCTTPDSELGIPSWGDEIAPSTARLNTNTITIEDVENPCLVPPTDGYTGLESQLYRVELHTVGDNQTGAFFKFSRENASVAASVQSISETSDRVMVERIGRDEILRFQEGDWVEITDDHREFNHRSGQLLRISVVNEGTREIELEGTIEADLIPSGADSDTLSARHTRLIRWDQKGTIRLENGAEWVNLDAVASDGLIPVPPAGTRVILESGIVIDFTTADGEGRYREMDYWLFAARTAGTQIEQLIDAPPDGIHRHISRLALFSFPGNLTDCRVLWPPLFEGGGDGCACTVCVSAESHNSGALTLQDAIKQVGPDGGTICMDGGTYEIQEPIIIENRQAITLKGQGMRTILRYRGRGSAVLASRAIDVQFERFSILVVSSSGDGNNNQPYSAGIHLINCAGAALRRIACIVTGENDLQNYGVAFSGLNLATKIEECLLIAPVAVGSHFDPSSERLPKSVALAETKFHDNILIGNHAAMRFSGAILNIGAFDLSQNVIIGVRAALQLGWYETPSGSTSAVQNTIISNDDAAAFSVGNLRLQDNEISGGSQDGHGVRLVASFIPEIESDAQITGNQIVDLGGSGIRVDAPMASLIIQGNVIRGCGQAAISLSSKADTQNILINNNILEDIGENSNEGVAIALSQVINGRITGNTIRNIGSKQTPSGMFAGIVLRGTRTISIDGNNISELHSGATKSPVSGISVRPPYRNLSITNNQINGADTNNDFGQTWSGIEIGPAVRAAASVNSARDINYPALASEDELLFAEFSGEVFALTTARLLSLGPSMERQITLNANQMQHTSDIIRPLVFVNDPQQTSCIFTSNQCQLAARGNVNALVHIIAHRIVASNNVVRRQSDADAMALFVGRSGKATVIGNLTFGKIKLTPPGSLPPEFADLNLQAST